MKSIKEGIKERYLLFRIKSFNDSEAYGQIYDRYIKRIYRFIFFKVGKAADAEDLASDTFLKAWQYLKEGKPIRNFNALLYSIARNLVVDFYRQETRKKNFEENVGFKEIKTESQFVKKLEWEQNENQLLETLKSLKDEYSEVLVLKFFDDLSTREIAQALGKSQNNTRVLVHRALGALRKVLEERQITDDNR